MDREYQLRVPIAKGQWLSILSNGPIGLGKMDTVDRYLELQRSGMVADELADWFKVMPESFIDDPTQ